VYWTISNSEITPLRRRYARWTSRNVGVALLRTRLFVVARVGLKNTFSALGSVQRGSTRLVALLCVAAAVALTPVGALAASRPSRSPLQAISAQCPSGHLSGDYTLAQLQQALSVMPSTVRQYTSCPDVVQAAIFRTQHHRGSTATISTSSSFLPTPLVAILVVLILGAGGFGALALRRR
jgi:hypothetical protein